MTRLSILALALAAAFPALALAAPPEVPTAPAHSAPAPAPAASTAPLPGAGYLAARARLTEQVNLLTLEVQAQKLQAKLHPQAAPQSAPAAATSSSKVVAQVRLPSVPIIPAMTLVSVFSSAHQHTAAIRAGGMVVTAHRGSVLPNGWKVASITATRVTLVRGREVTRLAVNP